MLASFMVAVTFHANIRNFGLSLAFPVGAVFFVAILAAIVEVGFIC